MQTWLGGLEASTKKTCEIDVSFQIKSGGYFDLQCLYEYQIAIW